MDAAAHDTRGDADRRAAEPGRAARAHRRGRARQPAAPRARRPAQRQPARELEETVAVMLWMV